MNTATQIMSTVETLTVANVDCTLNVTVMQLTPEVLELRYQIKNTAAYPIYLCNRLYKNIEFDANTQRNIYMVEPNLANIVLDGTSVTVGKAVVDVPRWVLVEALQIPCLSRILPQETYTEVFQVREPLMPYTVYEPGPHRGNIITCTLYFKLGYFLAGPSIESSIDIVNTPVGPVHHTAPFPASEQTTITVGPFAKQVQVVSEE
ncbi:hypothetical protein [Hymenobacter weizhouensis]|uniref:hypothetical protein n=1 Tax=Hymenobacter sp. YIM 151500-1 TaxID=2987689 RepID=UPI0022268AC3|nr:hypothetical protein [Hymenobacter sp. YIM 151500-1]UYZ64405.1 hypothetical protein OIS53_06020 [Hymenobacter sp. YIM 151500-1]